jgi:hypothetical protein
MILSQNGQKLIQLYKDMVNGGYSRTNGDKVQKGDVYNSFQLRKFRDFVKPNFQRLHIETVLDYGGGGSDWDKLNFGDQTRQSAKEFFGIRQVTTYEPARNKNKKLKSDCVVCMDVLEHIFLADVTAVIRELFSLSKKLLVINVACYEAAALLPTGENAHITVREPSWWMGVITSIANEFPDIEVLLICSETYQSGLIYTTFKAQEWHNSEVFTIDDHFDYFGTKKPTPPKTAQVTAEDILKYVDLLTKQHPQTGTLIQKILEKNLPFLVSK